MRSLEFGLSISCINITIDDIVYFGEKCGHKLRSLKLLNKLDNCQVRQMISLTPNLTDTDIKLVQLLMSTNNSTLLPKLKEYSSGEYYFYNDFGLEQLTRFQNEYNRMTKLKLSLNNFNHKMISKAFTILSGFYELREMNLISGRKCFQFKDIAQGMRQMAVSLKHLTKQSVN